MAAKKRKRHQRIALGFAIASAAALFGCARNEVQGEGDASTQDAYVDTARSAGPCEPGCHYDCFRVPTHCTAGKVWSGRHAPWPCCHSSDPRPANLCSGELLRTCDAGCAALDPRYASCVTYGSRTPPHVIGMFCNEGAPRSAGAPCMNDDDCRPAVEGQTLACDIATAKCIATARPPKPPGYGETCALTKSDIPMIPGIGDEDVIATTTCPVCYVARDSACIHSYCSLACAFDEDCPTGSICACMGASVTLTQVCVPDSLRSIAGRISAIGCESLGDAGVDAPADSG